MRIMNMFELIIIILVIITTLVASVLALVQTDLLKVAILTGVSRAMRLVGSIAASNIPMILIFFKVCISLCVSVFCYGLYRSGLEKLIMSITIS